MADVILRLEKKHETVDKAVHYVEFQREARNTVKRLWNKVSPSGVTTAMNERENFHTAESVEEYLKNAKKQYLGQGYAIVFPATTKKAEKEKEPETIELT